MRFTIEKFPCCVVSTVGFSLIYNLVGSKWGTNLPITFENGLLLNCILRRTTDNRHALVSRKNFVCVSRELQKQVSPCGVYKLGGFACLNDNFIDQLAIAEHIPTVCQSNLTLIESAGATSQCNDSIVGIDFKDFEKPNDFVRGGYE